MRKNDKPVLEPEALFLYVLYPTSSIRNDLSHYSIQAIASLQTNLPIYLSRGLLTPRDFFEVT